MAIGPQSEQGLFIETTVATELGQLQDVEINSPLFRELIVRLYNKFNEIALALNEKDTGIYPLSIFTCGQSFFPDPTLSSSTPARPIKRQVRRKVINFGALPNNALKTVAHGINFGASPTLNRLTRLYGAATDPINIDFIPIPYLEAGIDFVSLFMDSTNINIVTNADYSAFTECFVIIEYI